MTPDLCRSGNLTPAWQPLLRGRQRDRATEVAATIAAALAAVDTAERPRAIHEVALDSGSAGRALFFAYLAAGGFGAHHRSTALKLLHRATDAIATMPATARFYSGFPGVAWAASHLSDHIDPSFSPDAFVEIDDALGALLGRSPWDREFDLGGGLVGLGVYALERLPHPAAKTALERVIDRLEELARRTREGVVWRTYPELLPESARVLRAHGDFDLGMAHAAGVATAQVRSLAMPAVRWLLAQKGSDGSQSHFAAWTDEGLAWKPARTAWCYGDPGVAASLVVAGRAFGIPEWEAEGRSLALTAACRSPGPPGMQEGCLCHGAAGLAHILNRLYQATRDEVLADAARAWFDRLFEMQRLGEGIGGFTARAKDAQGRPCRIAEPGFLNGSVGIGLAVLAAVSDVEPEWDRLLLLSLPGGDL